MASDVLERFMGLRDRDYARQGLLVCEGRLVLEKALAAGLELDSALCVPADEAGLRDRLAPGTPLEVLPQAELASLVGFSFHRGVLALAKRPPFKPANSLPAGHTLVLWNVTDPDNLGTLIRSAAALGARSVCLGGGCADPYGRKALRASMGVVLGLPVAALASLDELKGLPGRERRLVVAAALTEQACSPSRVIRRAGRRPVALVVGNEGWGLPDDVVGACDLAVRLPMSAGVDSLNVAAAGAILTWELFSRRGRFATR
ncbi:MAG: RNA methyltransferase [Spirochaetales bacterium]|nr:RNA methyltransferase [Spirochaetales bacterium]